MCCRTGVAFLHPLRKCVCDPALAKNVFLSECNGFCKSLPAHNKGQQKFICWPSSLTLLKERPVKFRYPYGNVKRILRLPPGKWIVPRYPSSVSISIVPPARKIRESPFRIFWSMKVSEVSWIISRRFVRSSMTSRICIRLPFFDYLCGPFDDHSPLTLSLILSFHWALQASILLRSLRKKDSTNGPAMNFRKPI